MKGRNVGECGKCCIELVEEIVKTSFAVDLKIHGKFPKARWWKQVNICCKCHIFKEPLSLKAVRELFVSLAPIY